MGFRKLDYYKGYFREYFTCCSIRDSGDSRGERLWVSRNVSGSLGIVGTLGLRLSRGVQGESKEVAMLHAVLSSAHCIVVALMRLGRVWAVLFDR